MQIVHPFTYLFIYKLHFHLEYNEVVYRLKTHYYNENNFKKSNTPIGAVWQRIPDMKGVSELVF